MSVEWSIDYLYSIENEMLPVLRQNKTAALLIDLMRTCIKIHVTHCLMRGYSL